MIELKYIGRNPAHKKSYICHFTDLLTKEESHSDTFIMDRYNLAKKKSRKSWRCTL